MGELLSDGVWGASDLWEADDMQQVLSLELNELIFPYIGKYVVDGQLPTFKRLFQKYGYTETVSEERFSEIEPWIQWVSAHTGKRLREHGVFRLGDMVGKPYAQIWEHLEERGARVGAISPMNGDNRLKNACFFMPDPWTDTYGSGSWLLIKTYKAIKQAVNDNAQKKVTVFSVLVLLLALVWYSRLTSIKTYASMLWHAVRGRRWAKAIFLDRLLADIFLKLCVKTSPHYASLFLNAAAHIQHHFLYNSRAYAGGQKNPRWYIDSAVDPLLEAYKVYDDIIADSLALPGSPRLMIATALQQEPHGHATFFYRFKDHEGFFKAAGVLVKHINSLMSRDFVMEFGSVDEAAKAAQLLADAHASSGERVFSVDNRGSSLFVELIYSKELTPDTTIHIGGRQIERFVDYVAFVAIRNGQHNGTGYLLDTGCMGEPKPVPITDLWHRVEAAVSP